MAAEGFEDWGLDASPTGLERAVLRPGEAPVTGHFTLHAKETLPYPDCVFGGVLSVQLIHHIVWSIFTLSPVNHIASVFSGR